MFPRDAVLARGRLKKLLLVNAEGASLTAGGAETIVAMLAHGLMRRGWDVAVLAAFPAEDPGDVALLAAVHSTSWRSSGTRRVLNHLGDLAALSTRRLHDTVRAAEADVVHTHNLPGLSTAVWGAAAATGARVVHTLHDYYLLCPRVTLRNNRGDPCGRGAFCRLRSKRLHGWTHAVDAVVGVSEQLVSRHDDFFPRAKAHVIRHPVPTTPRAMPPPSSPPRTIGYLGALEVIKGVHVLLAAAPHLVDLGFQVRIAGTGRLREAVESAARIPGVTYVGYVTGEARDAFIASCDLGVVPSVWDEPGGPPLALLDWLAAGRPALSSGRGGLAEIEGARGVIDVEPTADGVVHAATSLRDPQRWTKVRQIVRPPALPSAEEWLDRYEHVLRGGGPDQ